MLYLLLNEDPESVPALVAELPAAIRRDMAGLDLKTRDASRLRAKLLLVHGRDDAIIPYTESLALAAALPPDQVMVHIVEHLAHMGIGQAGPIDSLVLWRAAYDFLSARDVLAREWSRPPVREPAALRPRRDPC